MIVFPNCKINLGLHIVRKRDDGYHALETVFYPLPVRDALEVVNRQPAAVNHESAIVNREPAYEGQVQFTVTGLPVNGKPEDNLCIKAFNLLKKDFAQLPGINMHLHKAIPMGAGLGGGSADGAFTLILLNEKFQLGISQQQLLDYALQLGSDCPFFIINKPCYATGRGEALEPVALDLSAYSFMLVHPGIHINTGWAFSQLSPAPSQRSLKQIVQQPVKTWRTELVNDFEAPVCGHHPELAAIKEQLYNAGALYASMTGSGSCFYGIFRKDQLPVIEWPSSFRIFMVS